jgi:hypothetical protein
MLSLSSRRNTQELFLKFNYDIRKLAISYPVDSGDRLKAQQAECW